MHQLGVSDVVPKGSERRTPVAASRQDDIASLHHRYLPVRCPHGVNDPRRCGYALAARPSSSIPKNHRQYTYLSCSFVCLLPLHWVGLPFARRQKRWRSLPISRNFLASPLWIFLGMMIMVPSSMTRLPIAKRSSYGGKHAKACTQSS
jgi:hypothetical protein